MYSARSIGHDITSRSHIIDISIIKVKKQRAPGLIAIVLYKSFVASLLTVTSIALLLALNSHHPLEAFSESLFLETN
jgi:hypothetical protein